MSTTLYVLCFERKTEKAAVQHSNGLQNILTYPVRHWQVMRTAVAQYQIRY